jgi:hypothetical protein
MPSLRLLLHNHIERKYKGGDTVEIEAILKIICISLVSWILVLFAIKNLRRRRSLLGGRNNIWALSIVFVMLWYAVLLASSSPF